MSDFAKMDIFFIVTTIVVIMLGIVATLILFRIWRILGHVEEISSMLSEEGTLMRKDIGDLRETVRREGLHMRFVGNFFRNISKRYFGGRSKK